MTVETTGTNDMHTLREKASHALESVRDASRERARVTAESIEGNPVGMLVGGLALGALVGALVPRSQREKDLLAPVGKRVNETAAAALVAARDAGRAELDTLGISREAARDQVRSLVDGLLKAASTAGSAASQAGRDAAKAK